MTVLTSLGISKLSLLIKNTKQKSLKLLAEKNRVEKNTPSSNRGQ